jgi:hypothetical protein
MRTRCLAVVIVGIVGCLAAPARAEPKAEIAAKTRAAMASYDAMDYEAARRLLNQALAIAKKAKLDKDPVVARVYLDLGIAQLAGSDQEAAKVSFLSAAQIDPRIAVDPGYKSPELVKMLDDAKAAAGASEPEPEPGVDCKSVRGLQHTIVEAGRPGTAQPIEALIGTDLSPARVVVMYRPEGAIDFTEAKLTRQAGCKYAGTIPGSAMHGAVVHYYVAAYDANNKALAAKGTSGAPNVLELGGAGTPAHETEDPVNGTRTPSGGGDTSVSGRAVGGKPSSIVLSVAGGVGLGYVTGKTEGGNKVQTCCIGTSLAVITPEIAYAASRKLSIGIAFRLGLPIGANITGHSSSAPAGFVRVHYGLSASGDGVHVMGELGLGILRNTLKVDAMTMPGMDTDIVAQGPLLVGAGLGYTRHLGGSVAFLAQLDAIAGIAVVDKLGSAINLNTGFGGDLSLGLSVGF